MIRKTLNEMNHPGYKYDEMVLIWDNLWRVMSDMHMADMRSLEGLEERIEKHLSGQDLELHLPEEIALFEAVLALIEKCKESAGDLTEPLQESVNHLKLVEPPKNEAVQAALDYWDSIRADNPAHSDR